MVISKKDLEFLQKLEGYLCERNTELYCEVHTLNTKLITQRDKTNKANWERIKAKREIDKNYARSKKEGA